MKKIFEWSAGSIVGTDHRKPFVWKNNQDAFTVRESDNCFVAVVADGCGGGNGGGLYSELGARLGAHLAAGVFSRIDWTDEAGLQDALLSVRAEIIASLTRLLESFAVESRSQFVVDNFLFTLLALVITPEKTFVIGVGDGVYAVNGEVTHIGPFPGNEPPYLVYGGLVKSHISPELCDFAIHRILPTAELQSACIGTDGAGDFKKISGLSMPVQLDSKKNELVGPLSQFWEGEQFFKNPEAIRRRLNLINNSVSRPNWETKEMNIENGRLKDDTTLVVVRRRPQPKD